MCSNGDFVKTTGWWCECHLKNDTLVADLIVVFACGCRCLGDVYGLCSELIGVINITTET